VNIERGRFSKKFWSHVVRRVYFAELLTLGLMAWRGNGRQ